MTAPRPSPAPAARTMPGSAFGGVAPPPRPSIGRWPPWPGRCFTARATSTPATPRARIGHHAGGSAKPSPAGDDSQTVLNSCAGQEAEGDERERDPEECRDEQQHQVARAVEDRPEGRVGGRDCLLVRPLDAHDEGRPRSGQHLDPGLLVLGTRDHTAVAQLFELAELVQPMLFVPAASWT